jgi:2,4-dienoyl-CoA reductase-like NADH-dependent reductase (Old Yellow Enzyme family)
MPQVPAQLETSEIAVTGTVELQGTNSHLTGKFFDGGTNRRTDQYGGSIATRARFLLAAVAVEHGYTDYSVSSKDNDA